MAAEAVKVIVRCRPMNKREKELKCKPCVFMDQKVSQCSIVNVNDPSALPKTFTFDGAYYTDSTTEQIYNEIAYPLVEGVLEGYNGTVFAYGQTGCGKSFSMQGIHDPPTQRGIIPRSFEHIFEAIDASENMKYLVHASYLEIYNEEIRDLLGKDVKKKLDLKEHPDKGVYVPDISLHPVHNTNECEALMERGWKNRATGATLMNAESSRSHSIFTINIEMMRTSGDDQHIRKGKLNLVDLAGSERQSKTQASGDRLKEANKINLSLSALGNVISALVDGKSKHIPYRDSKLTRLLQDSLGGNTKTMMVACLSPADNNYDETISTLRYANRAKNIKNKPKINEDPKDALLREYQDEIEKLKAMLNNQGQDGSNLGGGLNEALLEEERNRMRDEYENEMAEMRRKMEREKQTKAQMQTEIEAMKKEYDQKLKDLEARAATAKLQRSHSIDDQGNVIIAGPDPTSPIEVVVHKKEMNKEQQTAMEKLKKLQEEMIDGGKRAGDKNLKERRKQKKRAVENRLKALGEALGHVDDEDGVLIKVYDDIQEELRIKTDALRQSKHKVKALNAEIRDLQQEFEDDRTDYLDTIRRQDQQLKLLQQILEKIQPTIRKDCNYSNLEKVKIEAIWNDESQRWRIPDLIMQKTKLPPAGGGLGLSQNLASSYNNNQQQLLVESSNGRVTSKTAPARLEGFDDDNEQEENNALAKRLAQSEAEDVVGNYFKPIRASRLMAQAQETQRVWTSPNFSSSGGLLWESFASRHQLPMNNAMATNGPKTSNSNLSSSFNSGLNTFGLNNSYGNGHNGIQGSNSAGNSLNNSPQFNSTNNGLTHHQRKELPAWLQTNHAMSNGSPYSTDLVRKPTRLEALPDKKNGGGANRKRSGPILNTMGTF